MKQKQKNTGKSKSWAAEALTQHVQISSTSKAAGN